MVGKHISLLCDLSHPNDNYEIALVLWYRYNIETPIYTLDSRNRSLAKAKHKPSRQFSGRATFSLDDDPISSLIIDPVKESDHGDFVCRIDYRNAPTKYVAIHLFVIGELCGHEWLCVPGSRHG